MTNNTTSQHPSIISFEYDYSVESWNLPRGTVPPQLKAQGVPHALWMHFWDYSQSVVERAGVRAIMKKKLRAEIDSKKNQLSQYRQEERRLEITKLDQQTLRDFDSLQRQAERLFPNVKAQVSKDNNANTHNNNKAHKFVLDMQLVRHSNNTANNTANNNQVYLHYDSRRASWNLPRDTLPSALAQAGVPVNDWIAIWDYGFGVNQRAKEREHLNLLHERELQLCQKSLTYMNSTHIASVDKNAASSTTATQIRSKISKLQRAKEANTHNTQKGWQELQRRASQKFEPYGVKVYLSRPTTTQDNDEQVCCGLSFQCPSPKQREERERSSPLIFQHRTPSAIWLHSKSTVPVREDSSSHHHAAATGGGQYYHQERTSPISSSSVWATIPKQQGSPYGLRKFAMAGSLSPASSPSSVAATAAPPMPSDENDEDTRKENAPPKPEAARKLRNKEVTSVSVWGHPVVLTYVHDDVPSRIDIEVSAPFSPENSFEDDDDDDDEDSHGYVVPPAPTDPPSSIGSDSTSVIPSPTSFKSAMMPKHIKLQRRVHFGTPTWHTFEGITYTKAQKKELWFSHEEREASRANTKLLAQRVIDNRNNGGSSHNVVFMDSETKEEVCWRGLEHAKKGNLSSRQETRRAFMMKVLEKQRQIQLDSWTTRRGTVTDAAGDLQQYAARHSRYCRERAQKIAASDAKEARLVYKESLRRTNLNRSSDVSVMSGSSSQSQNRRPHQHSSQKNDTHKNDIFQDYCRKMHMATKARMQPAAA